MEQMVLTVKPEHKDLPEQQELMVQKVIKETQVIPVQQVPQVQTEQTDWMAPMEQPDHKVMSDRKV
jgi:hypothetical protein